MSKRRETLDSLPFDDDLPSIGNFGKRNHGNYKNNFSMKKQFDSGKKDKKFWTGKRFAAFIVLILIMSAIGAQFGAGLYAFLQ